MFLKTGEVGIFNYCCSNILIIMKINKRFNLKASSFYYHYFGSLRKNEKSLI